MASKKIKNGDCFACKKPNTLTVEHVIPQALGGRLKANLYCKECNENFGHGIEAEITKQFGKIATTLRIKRERGKPQPFEVVDVKSEKKLLFDGETLRLKDPIVKKELEGDGKTLKSANITTSSEERLKTICDSIQERYEIPGEIKAFQDVNPGSTDTKYEIMIDSTLILRAVTKIAYGFLCIEVPKNIILSLAFEEVRAYIKDGIGTDLASANFVHTQFMTDYIRPLHKIHIALNRSENIVVGYVSLFGIYRFTILLAENYVSQLEWPDLDYTFDPVRRQEVFGNGNFLVPAVTRSDILLPRQPKKFVQSEINKGLKAITSYVDNYEFLGGELS